MSFLLFSKSPSSSNLHHVNSNTNNFASSTHSNLPSRLHPRLLHSTPPHYAHCCQYLPCPTYRVHYRKCIPPGKCKAWCFTLPPCMSWYTLGNASTSITCHLLDLRPNVTQLSPDAAAVTGYGGLYPQWRQETHCRCLLCCSTLGCGDLHFLLLAK